MAKDKEVPPTEVGHLDVLELENLQLKAEKAQAVFQRAVDAYNACFAGLGKKYKFDPGKDIVHFDTRKIERK